VIIMSQIDACCNLELCHVQNPLSFSAVHLVENRKFLISERLPVDRNMKKRVTDIDLEA
jgi:hypothetical protein